VPNKDRRRGDTQTGSRVKFHPADVFLPNVADPLADCPAEEQLEGTIVGFSDSGGTRDAFAMVEVVQKRTVIIPVEKLEPCGFGSGDRVQ